MEPNLSFSSDLDALDPSEPGVLERLCDFISLYPGGKTMFSSFVKDKAKLVSTRSLIEAGTFRVEEQPEEQRPLVVGLLLLYLKHQGEPLFPYSSFARVATIISATKGSTALCEEMLSQVIDTFKGGRARTIKAFLRMLSVLYDHKSESGLDSITLASRFGPYTLKHPPLDFEGDAPPVTRVKLMSALAILIENYSLLAPPEPQRRGSAPAPTPPPKKAELTKRDLVNINLQMVEEMLRELDRLEGRGEDVATLRKLTAAKQALF